MSISCSCEQAAVWGGRPCKMAEAISAGFDVGWMSAALRGLALCLIVWILCNASLAQDPPTGFTAIFNGHNLDGWHGCPHVDPRKWDSIDQDKRSQWNADMRQHWTIRDNALVNDGHGVYLTTDKEYGDIELLLEYKTVPLADSGIYLRATPQVQIWDSTEEAKFNIGANKGSGGLWNNSPGTAGKDPLTLADKPFGQWNQFRILQIGARTSVWLNDHLVVDHAIMENFWDRKLPLMRSGKIQLQTHGGEIQWRNIFVREIGADEANNYLAKRSGQGFTALFNGQDLSGWAGATSNYEVIDGTIRCKSGRGGVLHTVDDYADYDVHLEFLLPAGGNNGLAIRYPGTGDAAYQGMCELQILDNDAPQYDKLDSRQYHGSAYGMAAAHRGYLRPTGQWNYQHVSVHGTMIRVELNGTVILDTDLSQISDYLEGKPHPGKDLTTGKFGFAGHSDPVQFRNIAIRRH
ncbi:MAG: DUF1080 domain-containing protein [Pirellulaceae bacterium]|nr:DUF1080 domain-containing protein [Pirellulaceae bacterium]